MNKTIRFACVLLMINIITILSCSKSDRTNSDAEIAKSTELTIDEAKSWFSQKHAEDITTLSLLTKSNGEQRLTSYVPGAFAGNPDWKAYRHYQTNLGLLVALDNTSGKYGYRSFRDIIITKDSLGKLKDYVQEVKFDSAYFANLVKTKGTDPNIRAYMEPATFTGKVLLYTTSNLFIRGSIYENGVLVSEIKPKEGVIGTVGLGGSLLKSYIAVGGEDDQTLPEVIVVGHYPPPPPPPPPPYFPPPPPPYYPPPPPPPYGGGGGYYSPQTPKLPCEQAKQNNTDAKNFLKNLQDNDNINTVQLLAFENNIATDVNEKAILLGYKRSNVSTGPVSDMEVKYITSTVSHGTNNSVSLPATPAGMVVEGAIHTHPSSGYAPPSATDIYTFYNEVSGNSNFRYFFVYAADGSKYMMTVTDRTAFDNFITSYPKNSYVDVNSTSSTFNGWNEKSSIGKEFEWTMSFLRKEGMTDAQAYENAFAYILGKYTGVTLSKMDANGDFKSIFVKKDETEKEKKKKNAVLPATSDC